MQYMSLIHPFPTPDTPFTPDQSPVRPPIPSRHDSGLSETPQVVLGGYSYGSLILKHLPPVPSIVQRFQCPLPGSATDEVLLRASKLADQSNLEWINQARDAERENRRTKHEHKTSMTIGGEETSPDHRRSSREVKRSLDVPRSMDLGRRLRSLSHRGRRHESPATPLEQPEVLIVAPEVKYLLISPLTPPVSTLAAPALGQKPWNRSSEADLRTIGLSSSLAIYGDQDIFASAKKTRDWSDHMKSTHGSTFSSVEITGAGHFWVEQGVERQLRDALRKWSTEESFRASARTDSQDQP